jgi:cyclopropane-fatty-acyl-phospholipid synthase
MSEDIFLASAAPTAANSPPGRLQQLARRLLVKRMARLERGALELHDAEGTLHFGRAGSSLRARIEVLDPQFWADAVFGGSTGAGEAYIHGLWRCDDLTALVRIMVANRNVLEDVDRGVARAAGFARRLGHWLNRNSRKGSRRNISAHYDLGNDFFALFLDPTMNYSSGIFPSPDASMEEASIAKMDAICRKLDLRGEDHLVEIGSGWGGLAIHAASRYGCRVTSTTISRAQYALAAERVRAAGLEDRIELLLRDYRDLDGQYDKLVSVEMIEAVGHRYLDTYFQACSRLLKPDGLMLLQSITIRDQHYQQALREVDFIQRFVFPGGFLPSIAAIEASVARATDLQLLHLQDIGPHYAITLRKWRERFFGNIDRVHALGHDDAFVRLWEFYLCYCEGAFLERNVSAAQLLLAKPWNRRDPLGY